MKNNSQMQVTQSETLNPSSKKTTTKSLNNTKTITPDRKRSIPRSPMIKNEKEVNTTVYLNTMETSINNISSNSNSMLANASVVQEKIKTTTTKSTSVFTKIDIQSIKETKTRKFYSNQRNKKPKRVASTYNEINFEKNSRDYRQQLSSEKFLQAKHNSQPHYSASSANQSSSFLPKNCRNNSNSYSSSFLQGLLANSERRKEEEVFCNEVEDRYCNVSSCVNKATAIDTSGEKGNSAVSSRFFNSISIDTQKFIQIFGKIQSVINASLKPELIENLASVFFKEKDRSGNCDISNQSENKKKLDRLMSANALFFEIDTLDKEISEINKSYVTDSKCNESSDLKKTSSSPSDIDSTKLYTDILKVSSERRISIYKKFLEICIETIKEITEKVKSFDQMEPQSITSITITNEEKEKPQNTAGKKQSMHKHKKSKKMHNKGRLWNDEDNDDFGTSTVQEGVYANVPISTNINVNKPKEANMHFRVFEDGTAKSCDENEISGSLILGSCGSFDDYSDSEKEKEASHMRKRYQRVRSKSLGVMKIRWGIDALQAMPYMKLFMEDEQISDSKEGNGDGEGYESGYAERLCITTEEQSRPTREMIEIHDIPADSSSKILGESLQLNTSISRESDQRSLHNSETQRTIQVRFENIPENVLFTTGNYEEDGEKIMPESPKAIILRKQSKMEKVPKDTSNKQHCIMY